MPHYYFDLKNGTTRRDHVGRELVNDAAAIAQGQAVAGQASDETADKDHACHVSIIREDGHEVMRLPVANAGQNSASRLKKRS